MAIAPFDPAKYEEQLQGVKEDIKGFDPSAGFDPQEFENSFGLPATPQSAVPPAPLPSTTGVATPTVNASPKAAPVVRSPEETLQRKAQQESGLLPKITSLIKYGGAGIDDVERMEHTADLVFNDDIAGFDELRAGRRDARLPIAGNRLTQAFYNVARMIPYSWEGGKYQLGGRIIGGAAGLGLGVALGGPTGEEAATTATGAKLGGIAGRALGGKAGSVASAAKMYQLGVGELAMEFADDGVAPQDAFFAAKIGAIPYALIETSQIGRLLPGSEAAIQKMMGQSIRQTIKSLGINHLRTAIQESGEEGLQEIVKEITNNFAKEFGSVEGLQQTTLAQVLSKGVDEAFNVLPEMMLMPLGRTTVDATRVAIAKGRTQKGQTGGSFSYSEPIMIQAADNEMSGAEQRSAAISVDLESTHPNMAWLKGANDGTIQVARDARELAALNLSPQDTTSASVLRTIGEEKYGLPIVFVTGEGVPLGATSANAIYLNPKNPQASLLHVLNHEGGGHIIPSWVRRSGNQEHIATLDSLVSHIRESEHWTAIENRLRSAGVGTESAGGDVEINDEVIAMVMSEVLTNEDMMNSVLQENPTLFKKIYDMIAEFFKAMAESIGATMGYDVTSTVTNQQINNFSDDSLRRMFGDDYDTLRERMAKMAQAYVARGESAAADEVLDKDQKVETEAKPDASDETIRVSQEVDEDWEIFTTSNGRFRKRVVDSGTPGQPISGAQASADSASLSRRTDADRDARYAKAVELGDVETQKRLVGEAAKAAGFNMGPLWHGGLEGTVFDPKKTSMGTFSFTDSKELADAYAHRHGKSTSEPYYLRVKNMMLNRGEKRDPSKPHDAFEFQAGNPSSQHAADRAKVYKVHNPNQIKSADPIVRDDAGNVIPISQRFDSTKADVRLSRQQQLDFKTETDAEKTVKKQTYQQRLEERDDLSAAEESDLAFMKAIPEVTEQKQVRELEKITREGPAATITKLRELGLEGVTYQQVVKANQASSAALQATEDKEGTEGLFRRSRPFEARQSRQSQERFHSNTVKFLEKIPLGRKRAIPAKQWADVLQKVTQGRTVPNIKKSLGINERLQTELEETGFFEWLRKQKGSLTRQQLIDEMKSRQVVIEETTEVGSHSTFAEYRPPGPSGDYGVTVFKQSGAEEELEGTNQNHFLEPGYISHWRGDLRKVADTLKTIMFSVELQSDVHQLGREVGYQNKSKRDKAIAVHKKAAKDVDEYGKILTRKYGDRIWNTTSGWTDKITGTYIQILNKEARGMLDLPQILTREEISNYGRILTNYYQNSYNNSDSRPVEVPFKDTGQWAGYILRRKMREAAEEGRDYFGWTSGEMSAYAGGRHKPFEKTAQEGKLRNISQITLVRGGAGGGDWVDVNLRDHEGDLVTVLSLYSKQSENPSRDALRDDIKAGIRGVVDPDSMEESKALIDGLMKNVDQITDFAFKNWKEVPNGTYAGGPSYRGSIADPIIFRDTKKKANKQAEGNFKFYDEILPIVMRDWLRHLKVGKLEQVLINFGKDGVRDVWAVELTPEVKERVLGQSAPVYLSRDTLKTDKEETEGLFRRSRPFEARQSRVGHATPKEWKPEKGYPHGRPRLDKIDTDLGTGGKVQGWGFYTAEELDVARSYYEMFKDQELPSIVKAEGFDEGLIPRTISEGREQSAGSEILYQLTAMISLDPSYRHNFEKAIGDLEAKLRARAFGRANEPASEFLSNIFLGETLPVNVISGGSDPLVIWPAGQKITMSKIRKASTMPSLRTENLHPIGIKLEEFNSTYGNRPSIRIQPEARRELAWLVANKSRLIQVLNKSEATLYHLDVPNAVVPKLLPWDSRVSEEQREMIIAQLIQDGLNPNHVVTNEKSGIEENLFQVIEHHAANGSDVYGALTMFYSQYENIGRAEAKRKTSELLQRAGIPGNKYLDQGSRFISDDAKFVVKTNDGRADLSFVTRQEAEDFLKSLKKINVEGKISEDTSRTYNYVIWDQEVLNDVAILKKNEKQIAAAREEESGQLAWDFTRLSRDTLNERRAAANRGEKPSTKEALKIINEQLDAWREAGLITGRPITAIDISKAPWLMGLMYDITGLKRLPRGDANLRRADLTAKYGKAKYVRDRAAINWLPENWRELVKQESEAILGEERQAAKTEKEETKAARAEERKAGQWKNNVIGERQKVTTISDPSGGSLTRSIPVEWAEPVYRTRTVDGKEERQQTGWRVKMRRDYGGYKKGSIRIISTKKQAIDAKISDNTQAFANALISDYIGKKRTKDQDKGLDTRYLDKAEEMAIARAENAFDRLSSTERTELEERAAAGTINIRDILLPGEKPFNLTTDDIVERSYFKKTLGETLRNTVTDARKAIKEEGVVTSDTVGETAIETSLEDQLQQETTSFSMSDFLKSTSDHISKAIISVTDESNIDDIASEIEFMLSDIAKARETTVAKVVFGSEKFDNVQDLAAHLNGSSMLHYAILGTSLKEIGSDELKTLADANGVSLSELRVGYTTLKNMLRSTTKVAAETQVAEPKPIAKPVAKPKKAESKVTTADVLTAFLKETGDPLEYSEEEWVQEIARIETVLENEFPPAMVKKMAGKLVEFTGESAALKKAWDEFGPTQARLARRTTEDLDQQERREEQAQAHGYKAYNAIAFMPLDKARKEAERMSKEGITHKDDLYADAVIQRLKVRQRNSNDDVESTEALQDLTEAYLEARSSFGAALGTKKHAIYDDTASFFDLLKSELVPIIDVMGDARYENDDFRILMSRSTTDQETQHANWVAAKIEKAVSQLVERHLVKKFGEKRTKAKNRNGVSLLEKDLNDFWKEFGGRPTDATGGMQKYEGGGGYVPNMFMGRHKIMTPIYRNELRQALSARLASRHDKVLEYWKSAGLLSGIATMMQNPISNYVRRKYEWGPKKFVSDLFQEGRGAPHYWNSVRATRNVNNVIHRNAREIAKFAFRTEIPVLRVGKYGTKLNAGVGQKIGQRSGRKGIGKLFPSGTTLRLPFRMLTYQDEYAKAIDVQMALVDSFIGQNPKATTDDVMAYMNSNFGNILRGEGRQELIMDAMKKTWQNPNKYAKPFEAAATTKGVAFVVPFVNTPMNLFTQSLRMSPLGTLNMVKKEIQNRSARSGNPELSRYAFNRNNKEFLNDAAEQAIAWGVTLALMPMVMRDDDEEGFPLITGSRPSFRLKKGKSTFQRQSSMPPLHIRLGDKLIDYSRIEPLATVLPVIVDHLNAVDNIKKGDKAGKELAAAWMAVGTAATDKTFLGSLHDLIRALEDPNHLTNWGSNFVASWMPNIVRSTLRAVDPNHRDLRIRGKQMSQQWAVNLLGKTAYRFLPGTVNPPYPQYDYWGQPLSKMNQDGPASNLAFNLLSLGGIPIRSTKENDLNRMIYNWNNVERFAANREAKRKGVDKVYDEKYLARPDHSISLGRDRLGKSITYYMNDKEYQDFLRMAGRFTFNRAIKAGFNYNKPTVRDMARLDRIRRDGVKRAKMEILKRKRKEKR